MKYFIINKLKTPRHPLATLVLGYWLVFWYFYSRYPILSHVDADSIVWFHGNRDHFKRIAVEMVLREMEARGFLEGHSNKVYRLAEKSRIVLEVCRFYYAVGRLCRTKGTNMCPFRIGEVWEP